MASALDILQNVTTGTITTMLLKKGIRRSWMAGAMPFGFSGRRIVGPAFTLRFVPCGRISQRPKAGRNQFPPAAQSKPCLRNAWWSRMRWA